MKVCITAEGKDLSAVVDPRFGRCQYFMIVDTETGDHEAIENPNIEAMGGAGVQSAQLIAGKKVGTVVTGNIGPNAFDTLQAAGVKVVTGVSGTVKAVLEQLKNGTLETTGGPTVRAKHGAG